METEQTDDIFFMRQAISEAEKAYYRGEVPIGAVIVHDNRIIGRGHNLVETLGDATAHAEMQAITAASSLTGGKYLGECTLYVTVEPCIMCTGACFWSQLKEVVYGAEDPKRGSLSSTGRNMFHPKTVIRGGIMGGECSELMKSFFTELRK